MNNEVERNDRRSASDRETEFEARSRGSTFRGPTGPVGDHDHSDDHLALLYGSRDEQFDAVIPFVRRGLEADERCLYLADETDRDEIFEALRDDGVDVDEALESDALVIRDTEDAYLRDGSLDLEASLDLLETFVEESTADSEGARVTAEETWLLRAAEEADEFMALEARVNERLGGEDCAVLCQYDCERFPAHVLEDVIKTHPYLVTDRTISENFYYTPPETFFDGEEPATTVDRMIRTVRERTDAKTAVREHRDYLRDLYEATANADLTFEERVERLLELGCERFDLRGGALAHLPTWDDNFRAEVTVGPDMGDLEGELPIQPTEGNFCRQAIDWDEPTAVPDVVAAGWDDDPVFEEFGFATYFGIRVTAGTEPYGTFWFYDTEPRDRPFTEAERTFLELMGQWISTELERRRREEFLRTSYEITSDPDLTFAAKIERLLEHGRKWFGCDVGYFTAVDAETDRFEIVEAVGSHDRIRTGGGGSLSGTYCKKVVEAGESISVADAVDAGWEGDRAYDTYGLDAFLGTMLEVDGERFGTLCFGSETPREGSFTETEYTFIDLISQWVSTELERRRDERTQRELYEITADPDRSFDEQLLAVLDLGCERFDMELGGIATVDPATDRFEVETTNGDHEYLTPGKPYPLSETYCQAPVDEEGTCTITDPVERGYDGKLCYERFGVRAYLGTHLEIEGSPDRTFWFVSTESREEFSEAERTLHHLMGQWVKYELDRQQYERDLEETVERLQQSNDRLKQFAYAASHDLQEPLRMVSSYLQLLDNRYKGELDEEAREFIDFAVDGADRMREMIDDLLAFSRVEHADGEFEPVDCTEVLDRVQDDLQVRIAETDAEILVDSLPTVSADVEQFEQLFSNLVSNGIKYNESAVPRVEVSAADRDDRWEFAVADNGIGIESAKTDRIFEVFKRLHHDDEYPGTGIGLSLCQEIADNHGGDIRVESEPGAGSTFYITLPKRNFE
ncbi:GAF sensor signal transduction histidine kinase [Haloterrigena turkmenica DSM 5511]|uniref:histidine kinase n=1 Tax=Haloterrigena turkmenica (strain ATCC 51198 / DSM 5511 / JCM 9101 / NCIMB 13204 / VKM B-1734 / 4k) TaxID=543526 RepID=D2RZ51_HALTV|nr:MEDS domain-containing protein [Haloterrigena turkmenica]ADB59975.1 GAF sensor signal transduction histidine kinase [Haloterrigena turkmenica DSM 5511]